MQTLEINIDFNQVKSYRTLISYFQGAYATSRFIQLNGGELLLWSGHHTLDIHGEKSTVSNVCYWPGTIVALLIHTDSPVDYKDIMPVHHTLPDDYQFFIDKFFGDDNELW